MISRATKLGQRLLEAIVLAEATQRAVEADGVDLSPSWNRIIQKRDRACIALDRLRARYIRARLGKLPK